MSVDKLDGISGPDKICTLHPFEVLEVIDDHKEEEKEEEIPSRPPVGSDPQTFIDWLIKMLQLFKKTFNKK
ncbi:MAG: hypothetical protein J5I47_04695 [Vicingus serpentipes]|nr:hypothetical protein [Vicingus serpentipes]